MTITTSRADELRNDLENLHFTCRYYIGVLAELEQLGRTHTAQFKQTERNVNVLKHNIRRVQAELERAEEDEYMNYLERRFDEGLDLSSWND